MGKYPDKIGLGSNLYWHKVEYDYPQWTIAFMGSKRGTPDEDIFLPQ